jgi:bifunctional UDP-N-acetylglucosamine pyrophosphorylase/glucosamine-1-phosphate N-acetyltransferase
VPAPTVVVLAAGEGTRMRSALPKVLHPLCGRPVIEWVVRAAREGGAGTVVVVDNPAQRLRDHLPDDVELAVQERPRGTGDAVAAAAGHIDRDATVVVTYGDVPLLTGDAIRALVAAHERTGAGATMATMEPDDPTGYGRVVRAADGSVERVVETKVPGDATEEQLAIREVNTGVYAFEGGALLDALEHLSDDNAQGELYLPDVLPAIRRAGRRIGAHAIADPELTHGVDDRADLAHARAAMQRRIHERHMRAGVTIVDPASTLVDADVEIGQDTVVEPSSFLRGATRIGPGCVVGPLTTLIDVELGAHVTVPHSYLQQARVDAGASVGPFAYLRPGTHLHEGAKAGTFVEIKNSEIGVQAKVPHLSYIGDAEVGEHTNIAACNVTANYDGRHKHRTTIGARVHTSVDTTFVAPVTVGDDAYTGAGSVITDDVPPGALGIARPRQTNIEGYADRRRKEQ